MRKPIMTILAMAMAASLQLHADDSAVTGSTSRCMTNADGQPGKSNSGSDAGRGGQGGTIVRDGKQSADCASAKGGNGGNGNQGADSGRGGNGGTIRF